MLEKENAIMNNILPRFAQTALAAATLLAAGSLQAGLSVEADTVVADDFGGTIAFVRSGTHEAAGANVLTTATFDDFQARADGRIINGDLVKSRVRSVDQVESTYDGELEIAQPASATEPARRDVVIFDAVTITRQGQGPQLGGTVVVNGESFEASELPEPLAAAIRSILRLFLFA
jgi:hypothetical protein